MSVYKLSYVQLYIIIILKDENFFWLLIGLYTAVPSLYDKNNVIKYYLHWQ